LARDWQCVAMSNNFCIIVTINRKKQLKLIQKIKIALIFTLFLGMGMCYGQSEGRSANVKMKSIFVYNFIKNVEWPEGVDKTNYKVGVVGDQKLYNQMNTSYSGKVINGKKLVFEYYSSFKETEKCHMLYIDPSLSDELQANVKTLRKNKTLVVTDKGGLLSDGSVINFVISNNKLRFEISNTNAQLVPLTIGPALIKMATSVI